MTRSVLVLALAVLAGLANQVQAAPASTRAAPVRNRRATPFELPRKPQAELAFSFGQENITVPAEDPPVAPWHPWQRRLAFSQVVDLGKVDPNRKNIVWSRLMFDPEKTFLRSWWTGHRDNGTSWGEGLDGDQLRITSLQDNSVQYFNNQTLRKWNFRSAFFNGGRIRVELLADRRLARGRHPLSVVVKSVMVNNDQASGPDDVVNLPAPNSLCNAADLRRPSNDPRSGRIFPVGCTGWTALPNGCQLTAGHCFDGLPRLDDLVLQANVPASAVLTIDGRTVSIPRHPPASMQWAIDPKSIQFALVSPLDVQDLKDAQDWATFGTLKNPNTGLNFFEASNKQRYTLAEIDPATGQLAAGQASKGSLVTVTGYGIVRDQARRSLHQTQQTHSGTIYDFPSSNHIDHRVDTEPGNSGSPIAIGDLALGIHTNGGCETASAASANWGSSINMPALQAALQNQRGVCATAA